MIFKLAFQKKPLFTLFAIACSCYLVGFLVTLVLHYKIRPIETNEAAKNREAQQIEFEAAQQNLTFKPLAELNLENEQLLITISEIELELDQATEVHNINSGHARALMTNIQDYRDERTVLFEELKNDKIRLQDKIDELDNTITAQIEERLATVIPQTDYEIVNELTGLLAYPHPLNDNEALYNQVLNNPRVNKEFVDQRFELMLQPVDFNHNDAVYTALEVIVNALNTQHENNTEILWVNCSTLSCEIQISLLQVDPYFDYWQQFLDELMNHTATKNMVKNITTVTSQNGSTFQTGNAASQTDSETGANSTANTLAIVGSVILEKNY